MLIIFHQLSHKRCALNNTTHTHTRTNSTVRINMLWEKSKYVFCSKNDYQLALLSINNPLGCLRQIMWSAIIRTNVFYFERYCRPKASLWTINNDYFWFQYQYMACVFAFQCDHSVLSHTKQTYSTDGVLQYPWSTVPLKYHYREPPMALFPSEFLLLFFLPFLLPSNTRLGLCQFIM